MYGSSVRIFIEAVVDDVGRTGLLRHSCAIPGGYGLLIGLARTVCSCLCGFVEAEAMEEDNGFGKTNFLSSEVKPLLSTLAEESGGSLKLRGGVSRQSAQRTRLRVDDVLNVLGSRAEGLPRIGLASVIGARFLIRLQRSSQASSLQEAQRWTVSEVTTSRTTVSPQMVPSERR